MTAERCKDWVYVVWQVSEDGGYEIDPGLILALMAKESGCDPNAGDVYSDSVGLMQVNPRSLAHLGISKASLLDPLRNVYWGMRILRKVLEEPVENPEGDVRRALAAYNCGWASLNAGRCYSFGGYAYADQVLEEWLPPVRAALQEYSAEDHEVLRKYGVEEGLLDWLGSWGYAAR